MTSNSIIQSHTESAHLSCHLEFISQGYENLINFFVEIKDVSHVPFLIASAAVLEEYFEDFRSEVKSSV